MNAKKRFALNKNIGMIFFLCLLAGVAGCKSEWSHGSGNEITNSTADNTINNAAKDITKETPEHTADTITDDFVNDMEGASEGLKSDYEMLSLRADEGIRGNMYLPTTGEHGSRIQWVSSHPDIISDREVLSEDYASIPAGVVNRQDADRTVELTAYLTDGDTTLRKKFSVVVLARPEAVETTDYLFAYFTGNGAGQEAISFAVSRDGFSWETLNQKQPVLVSTLGTKGLRDPFLLRSAEGDRFFLIATDLCIASDGDWWKAQSGGSRSIMVWESADLVHWSEQRMVTVNQSSAGCTWAPEAYYDEKTGEYLVFFASRVGKDGYAKQRIYYVKTRDFIHFTEPEIWMDYAFDTIDTTVIREGDRYYRFTKYEGESRIILECADSLLGVWERVPSDSLDAQKGVEGPCCFALNADDAGQGANYALLLDNYGGSGYYMMITGNLAEAVFEKKTGYSLPRPRPRHGTVLPLTAQEYQRLKEAY